jgi:hypothetical protein
VEKILGHSSIPTKLKTLQFHVKWRGYDAASNTWEPWKNLRETESLNRYLLANGMQKLIPAKFKEENYPELAGAKRQRRNTDAVVNAMMCATSQFNSLTSVSTSTEATDSVNVKCVDTTLNTSARTSDSVNVKCVDTTLNTSARASDSVNVKCVATALNTSAGASDSVNVMCVDTALNTSKTGSVGRAAPGTRLQFASIIATYWDDK